MRMTQVMANNYRKLIALAADSLSDVDALKAPMLFDRWQVGVEYKAGKRVYDEGVLYTVLQKHTSQADWRPANTPSLFAKVLIPDPTVIPEWEQPDSTNPYMKGDKVRHNGKKWESMIDGNVWEPGAIGTEALWVEF